MNDIQVLWESLRDIDGLSGNIDSPVKDDGVWWLDIRVQGLEHIIIVEWHPCSGEWGISTHPNPDPNSLWSADEFFGSLDVACMRVLELIETRGHSVPGGVMHDHDHDD